MKKTTPPTDDTIVALYFERDEEAIRQTHDKYGGYLYTVCYNLLHDPLDCEECRNDTYLRAWNTIPPKRPERLLPYLTALLRSIAVDRWRERSRQKRVPSELTVSLDDLAEVVAAPEDADGLAEMLAQFLQALPKRKRLIFISRYYCADPPERIAAMLGITPSAVYKELKKIKEELRKHLEKEGYTL